MNRVLGAEALGTGLLTATVIGSGIMGENISGGIPGIALLGNTLATAAVLYVLVTLLRPVSGAHLNPVVTVVMAARGATPWASVPGLVIAQTLGAAAGAATANLMFGRALFSAATTVRAGGGQWLAEAIATFVLVLAIVGVARSRPERLPATVALTITAGYWFTASTSFANPAVTIARSLSDSFAGIDPANVPAFIVAQAAGAVIAVVVDRALLAPQSAGKMAGEGSPIPPPGTG